jgi:penicillin-insensitive murein endopeptidase
MRLPIASLSLPALAASLGISATTSPGVTHHHALTARATSTSLAALRYGRSVGSPTEGHLVGGAHLDETGYLRIVPADAAGDVRWGLEPLVGMIDRSARAVRRQFPDAVTSVGHLSREGGGEIDRHRSHESGRDADIGFFVRTSTGKPLVASHFVPFRADGSAPTWPGAVFDDARNWALVASLLADPEAHVTHVFVAMPLRARLLAYAERVGVPSSLRVRAAELMQQPRGALPHDDHFHVRIGCPAHMTGCVEDPAARPRHPELVAHGRRGGTLRPPTVTLGSNTVEPAIRSLGNGRDHAAPQTPRLPPPPRPAGPTPAAEPPSGEPEAPPASIASPIDDVDG